MAREGLGVRVIPFRDLPGRARGGRFEGAPEGADVSFFVVRAPEGEGPGLHRHPYEETFVLLEGSATFTVDGETMDGVADTVIVVPAGAVHKFVAGPQGLTSVNIHPRGRMEQEDLEEA
jgi:quercetin dioxygenase-like cupin family protein